MTSVSWHHSLGKLIHADEVGAGAGVSREFGPMITPGISEVHVETSFIVVLDRARRCGH